MTIEELKRAAEALPPRELVEFSNWVTELREAKATAPAGGTPALDDAAFEADIAALAEGTEHLVPYRGTYSRNDIYGDHD